MAFTLIALAALTVGTFILTKAFAPRPEVEKVGAAAFVRPQVREGIKIPIIYGTVRARGPNAVETIGFSREKVEKNGTVAYAYQLSMRLLFANRTGSPTLLRISFNDETVWTGSVDSPNDIIRINDPGFFGGKTEGGGIGNNPRAGDFGVAFSRVRFYPGDASQSTDSELQAIYTAFESVAESELPDAEQVPAYRHFVSLVFANFNWGESGTLPDVSADIRCIPDNIPGFAQDSVGINGDANPAEVIYDLMTNTAYGLGYPTSRLDSTSFAAAASTLQTEANGVAMIIDTGTKVRATVESVLRQIDGLMWEDPATGVFKIKLVRDDFGSIESLVQFNETNVIEVSSFSVPTPEQTFNQINLTYTSREGGKPIHEERGVFVQDGENILSTTDEQIRWQDLSFPSISNAALAVRIAGRELKTFGLPLARAAIKVNRDAYEVEPGQAIRFTWAEYDGIDLVMRVVDINYGTLESNAISLELAQDRFAFGQNLGSLPESIPPFLPTPGLIVKRRVIESPRWFNTRLVEAERPEDARLIHLADSPALGIQEDFRSLTSADGIDFDVDRTRTNFAPNAQVSTAYPYSTNEYDTTTGLVIKNFSGSDISEIPVGSEIGIRQNGGNMILVNNELMFFEARTDLGGGLIRLTNVWRGGLDTVPADHAVDDDVWFITGGPGIRSLGQLKQKSSGTVYSKALGQNAWTVFGVNKTESLETVMVNRAVKPHPADNYLYDGVKAPGVVLKDAATHRWNRRQWDLGTVYRGDDSDDAQASLDVLEQLEYDVDGRVFGDGAWVNPSSLWSAMAANQTSDGGGLVLPLSVGVTHGDVRTRVRANHLLLGALRLDSFQSPEIQIHAHRHRNLLRNFDFSDGLNGWVVGQGTPAVADGSFGDGTDSLGGATSVGTGSPDPFWVLTQSVSVNGWNAEGLTAFLHWYVKLGSDIAASDQYVVKIIAFDSVPAEIGSVTTGKLTPTTTWENGPAGDTLKLELPANTVVVQVRVESYAVGEFDDNPSTFFDAFELRVGQADGQDVLFRKDFDSGTAPWTVESGAWNTTTGSHIQGANALVCTTTGAGSYVIHRDITITDGYREQSTSFFRAWLAKTSANGDTVEMRIEALDAGTTVLGSTTTGALTPGTDFNLQELVLDLPDGTVKVRHEFVVVNAVGGSAPVVRVDAPSAWVVKELHPTEYYKAFTVSPAQQVFSSVSATWETLTGEEPRSIWLFDDGASVFEDALGEGTDSHMLPLAGTQVGRQFCGWYNGTDFTSKACFETTAGNSEGAALNRQSDFDMDGNLSWVLLVPFKAFPSGVTRVLAGSLESSGNPQGWEVRQLTNGRIELFVGGNTGLSVTTGKDGDHNHGQCTWFAVKYRAAAGMFQLITEIGEVNEVAIPGGVLDNLEPVRIGCSPSGTSADAQFAGAVGWYGASSENITKLEIDEWWNHGETPADWQAPTGNVQIGPIESDSDGEVVVNWLGSTQFPLFRTPVIRSGSNKFGVPVNDSLTMLGAEGDEDPSNSLGNWQGAQGSAVVTQRFGTDPQKMKRSVQITSDNGITDYYGGVSYASPGTADLKLTFWARASSAHDAQVRLISSADAFVETETYSVTTSWQRIELSFTQWMGATSTFRFGFQGSTSASPLTVEIAGPVSCFVMTATDSAPWVTTQAGQALQKLNVGLSGVTLPESFNSEGEIQVQGICDQDGDLGNVRDIINATNGTNSNDRRQMVINAGDSLEIAHYDGSGTSSVGSMGVPANIDWAAEWTARGRWNRAGVLEDNVTTITYANGIAPDGVAGAVRAALWTAGTAVVDDIDVGTVGGANPLKGFVQEILITSRELPE